MMILSPSLLGADFKHLEEEIAAKQEQTSLPFTQKHAVIWIPLSRR